MSDSSHIPGHSERVVVAEPAARCPEPHDVVVVLARVVVASVLSVEGGVMRDEPGVVPERLAGVADGAEATEVMEDRLESSASSSSLLVKPSLPLSASVAMASTSCADPASLLPDYHRKMNGAGQGEGREG